MRLFVNGEAAELEVEPDTPLLWVLRENLGLTGAKYGCGVGYCGACTVHVDGVAVTTCNLPVEDVAGSEIVTIEGLGGAGLHPVQAAWIGQRVPQCGYCQTGVIMAVAALLAREPRPSDAEVDAAITNICRCGTYTRIREAIRALADA